LNIRLGIIVLRSTLGTVHTTCVSKYHRLLVPVSSGTEKHTNTPEILHDSVDHRTTVPVETKESYPVVHTTEKMVSLSSIYGVGSNAVLT
jgi:hypothetical protein